MSPTFEVTTVFRHSREEWDTLGQHGDPPQTVYRRVVRWKSVQSLGQFDAVLAPDLTIPDREPACVLTTDQGDLVILADYDRIWDEWNTWLTGERKRELPPELRPGYPRRA
ncbi:MAG: hypothetical protein NVSMB30_29890 [Hymenobacter sp.]